MQVVVKGLVDVGEVVVVEDLEREGEVGGVVKSIYFKFDEGGEGRNQGRGEGKRKEREGRSIKKKE